MILCWARSLWYRFVLPWNGLRYAFNHHVLFKIISNGSSQIRPVGRNIVWLISRRPEGVRSWELHHKNRRVALSPNIWVRRPNSLILNGSWRGRVRLTEIERVFGAFLGRNLGVGGWDFVRIEILTCSIDPYGCWELNPSKLLIFEPNKGENFDKILARAVWDPRL